MRYTLGVDIGTFESKGVLVDQTGVIIAQASQPHQMLVPQPGWAEHRPDQDWWGDFVTITKSLLAQSGIDPAQIAAVAASAIGPCMLPLDGAGRPLMNGVLYGVDTRAHQEITDLTAQIGADVVLARCGNSHQKENRTCLRLCCAQPLTCLLCLNWNEIVCIVIIYDFQSWLL